MMRLRLSCIISLHPGAKQGLLLQYFFIIALYDFTLAIIVLLANK